MGKNKRNNDDDEHIAASGAKKLCSQPGPSVHLDNETSRTKRHIGLKEVHCKKHPGHVKFISAPTFIKTHLPKVKNREGRELLEAFITLTVRLRVGYTSWKRDDKDDYASDRGTKEERFGTGFVSFVSFRNYCRYRKCPEPKNEKHYGFLVRTAHHVVYNSEEAKETIVDFNFNDDENFKNMISLKGTEAYDFSKNNDWCNFWTNTHDEELGEAIHNARKISYYSQPQRYVLSEVSGLSLDSEPVIIVSHPHGKGKYVTFGKLICNDLYFPAVAYDAPTCVGSSGARILRYELKDPELLKQYMHLAPVHCGGYTDGSYSFANWYWWTEGP